MRTVRETVALPDSNQQPLVHPLDLPESKSPFVASWWLSILALPAVAFFFAALLWIVSNNYLTPILVPVAVAVCAGLLSAHLRNEAWAYIPRRRQDSQRRLPTHWIVLRSVISTASLVAGLVTLTAWLVEQELKTGVLGYIFGSALGIVILMLVGLVSTAVMPAQSRRRLDSWTLQSTRLIAVGSAIAVGCVIVARRFDLAGFDISSVLIGAGVIIGVQVIWWLVLLWQSPRSATRSSALDD